MKTIGIFEAKTTLSAICEEVAASREPVTVTRRGKPLVCIEPISENIMTIRDRRAKYLAETDEDDSDGGDDFEAPPRSRELSDYRIEESK